MNEKLVPVGWRFTLGWVVSCVIGIVVFGLASFWLRWRLGEVLGEAAGVPLAGAVFALLNPVFTENLLNLWF